MACGGCKEIRKISDIVDKSDKVDFKGGKKILAVLSDILILIIGSIIGLVVIIPYTVYSMITNKPIKIKSIKRKTDEQ